MKRIILSLVAISSIQVFAETKLGIELKICKNTQELAEAKIQLISKINYETSEYIRLEQSKSASNSELHLRLRKIEEANAVADALNVFCKD